MFERVFKRVVTIVLKALISHWSLGGKRKLGISKEGMPFVRTSIHFFPLFSISFPPGD